MFTASLFTVTKNWKQLKQALYFTVAEVISFSDIQVIHVGPSHLYLILMNPMKKVVASLFFMSASGVQKDWSCSR